VCISILMTHYARRIGTLYAADLVGGSLGCLAAVVALSIVPAPVVPLIVAVLATVTATLLALPRGGRGLITSAVCFVVAVALLAGGLATDVVRMRYIKVWKGFYSEHEAWNSFSRISVFSSPQLLAPHTLPLAQPRESYTAETSPRARWLDIDGTAWTPMVEFAGDLSRLHFLRESVIYAAHHLRSDAKVLIIGTGGGRDLLAAKAFGQPSVLGIEINPLMERIVQHTYASYSGRPYTLPGVRVLIGEGRSTLAQLDDTFDIIQLSLVDTFAAGAAGGFVFSENYLYTTEAFREYFRHLTPQGVLSISRYFADGYPLEVMRLIRIATDAWRAEGIFTPGRHIVILRQGMNATALIKRAPYSDEELAALDAVAREHRMGMAYDPRRHHPGDDEVTALQGANAALVGSPSVTTVATTDDSPYFFHFLRARAPRVGNDPMNMIRAGNEALALMYLLIGTVSLLALLFFLGPLLLFGQRPTQHGPTTAAMLAYFVCLGFGFMMIEIPLLQRLVLLLGSPVYSLAVGLFSVLLFCGLGSLLSERLVARPWVAIGRIAWGIVATAAVYTVALPAVVAAFLAVDTTVKIGVAVAVLAPIALLLGMAYPVGIRVLREHDEALIPWAWGLNGAASVVASVLAVFVGSRSGFTVALVIGGATYALGIVAMRSAGRLRPPAASATALPPTMPPRRREVG
jgi:hypothetical protein